MADLASAGSEDSAPGADGPTEATPAAGPPTAAAPARSRVVLAWFGVKLVVIWALSVFVAVWALVRAFGLERGTLLVQFISFTPYVAVGALIPLVFSVLTGRWVAAALSAVALVTLLACVAPRALGSASTMDGVPVKVMAINMRLGGADARSIVDLVRGADVDVLTVQEYSPEAQANLKLAGIDDLLPYQHLAPEPGASGSGLYARFRLRDTELTMNPGWGFGQASATIVAPGAAPVEVHSVHPDPPGFGTGWTPGLRAQPPGGAGQPVSPLRILAGDFNATLDHAELRNVLATGYRDAAAEVGQGLLPTWPYFGARVALVPKITIDHVLVNGSIGVRDFTAITIPQTDHRAIVAILILPRV